VKLLREVDDALLTQDEVDHRLARVVGLALAVAVDVKEDGLARSLRAAQDVQIERELLLRRATLLLFLVDNRLSLPAVRVAIGLLGFLGEIDRLEAFPTNLRKRDSAESSPSSGAARTASARVRRAEWQLGDRDGNRECEEEERRTFHLRFSGLRAGLMTRRTGAAPYHRFYRKRRGQTSKVRGKVRTAESR